MSVTPGFSVAVWAAAAVSTVLLTSTPIRAQEPAALRDSLRTVVDTAALRSRLASSPARTASEFVTRGLIAFRRWELTHTADDLDAAKHEFERARDKDGKNVWAVYGVGLCVARSPKVRSNGPTLVRTGRSLSKELKIDDFADARRAMERALKLDAHFAPAAIVLAQLAVKERDRDQLYKAMDALRPIAMDPAGPEDAKLAFAQVYLAMGETRAAGNVAGPLASPPDALAEAKHTFAVALLNSPGDEAKGAAMYFQTVASMTPAVEAKLFEEVRYIATPRELAAWDSAGYAQRQLWFRDFWEMRAGLSGVTLAERLAEHYRRLSTALDRYARVSDGPQPGYTLEDKRDPAPLDDRGVIYLRHGEPFRVISTKDYPMRTSACQIFLPKRGTRVSGDTSRQRGQKWEAGEAEGTALENESWVYVNLDGGYEMYNFFRCDGLPDWVIPYDIPCDAGQVPLYVNDRQYFESEIRNCGHNTRERIREYAREALHSDTYAPTFSRKVPVIFDLLAFRGENGRTDLTTPLVISADSLQPDRGTDNQYRVGLTVTIVDTATRRVARSETNFLARTTARANGGSWFDTFVQLSALPTKRAELRIVVKNSVASDGSFFGSPISVPDYGGDSLMVSSIVLALPVDGGNWRRGNTTLRLMPYGEYAGGEFRAYYEIYNLPENQPYSTELVVEPWRQGANDPLRPPPGTPTIRLQFNGQAQREADGAVRELRSVESHLPAGRYRVTVTIVDQVTGKRASSWRAFVVPPAAGGR